MGKVNLNCKGVLIFVLWMLTLRLILVTGPVQAVQARPEPVLITQPDGKILTIRLLGDEFVHWAETPDGYTLLQNAQGFYEYAVNDAAGHLQLSGIRAHEATDRSQTEQQWLAGTAPGLFFSPHQVEAMKQVLANSTPTDVLLPGSFPPTGTRKLLMILANFSNSTPTYGQPVFDGFMNQVNYNTTGSFRDYYLEVSYGQLTVNTTVTVWVTLPNTHDYYGPDTQWGQFAFDAITAAECQAGINFAEFDNNLDGTVDGIAIVHQGQGQEETANITDIWSHSWNLTEAGYTASQRTFDGVMVNVYTTIPERNATGTGTIGVMCHEFGHNLGVPDFYDTDYTLNGYYSGTGCWDVMAGGSWNGVSGTKPAHHNAWTKNYLGWTNPAVLSTVQQVTLRSARLFPDVVRFNTQTPNEYFLCENRQQTGFDAGIPGHGMIIYHVDGSYLSAHLSSNNINTSSHQGMYPVVAAATGNPPATYGTINSTSCPFPGTGCDMAFTDVTIPGALSWAGAPTNLPVTGITEYTSTGEIAFCFVSCSTAADPAGFTAVPAGTNQVTLSWSPNPSSDPVLVAFNTTPVFGTPSAGTCYPAGSLLSGGGTIVCNGSASPHLHPGLNSNTTYYYRAWSVLSGNVYSTGVSSNATTLCGTVSSFPWSEGFENGGVIPSCWSQEQVNNSGLNWIFSAGNGSVNPAAAHSGAYNACLKDKTAAENKTRLITPMLDLTATINPRLTFWHTQPAWGTDQDRLSVYYRTSPGGSWTLLSSYTGNLATWTQETIPLPGASATYSIAFEGNARFGFGICLDDVQVASYCTTSLPVSITIAASVNPVYPGAPVTASGVAENGGAAPTYQWKVGGTIITGATNATFTYLPNNNDEITCLLTSSAVCAVNNPAISNPVIIAVIAMDTALVLENSEITGNECFNATQRITVAGNGTSFAVEQGASVSLIAGQRILLLPGTTVTEGGYLHGAITTSGSWCTGSAPAPVVSDPGTVTAGVPSSPLLKVYPNPTHGSFTLEINGMDEDAAGLEIYSPAGKRIHAAWLHGGTSHRLTLSDEPAGVYLLNVRSGGQSGTVRIVRY